MEGNAAVDSGVGEGIFVDLCLRVVKTLLHVNLEIASERATNIPDRYDRKAVSSWSDTLKRGRIWTSIANARQKELTFDLKTLIVGFRLPTLLLLRQNLHRPTPLHLFYRDAIATIPRDGRASWARKVLELTRSTINELAARASTIFTGIGEEVSGGRACVC